MYVLRQTHIKAHMCTRTHTQKGIGRKRYKKIIEEKKTDYYLNKILYYDPLYFLSSYRELPLLSCGSELMIHKIKLDAKLKWDHCINGVQQRSEQNAQR